MVACLCVSLMHLKPLIESSTPFSLVSWCRRGVPGYIVRILCYWYAHQTLCVRCGSSISSSFRVSNGVRQSGILSQYLFNVYVDDLSQTLNRCRTGCLSGTGNITINHLTYADDLVLLWSGDGWVSVDRRLFHVVACG